MRYNLEQLGPLAFQDPASALTGSISGADPRQSAGGTHAGRRGLAPAPGRLSLGARRRGRPECAGS